MHLILDAGTTNLKGFIFEGERIVWRQHHRMRRLTPRTGWVEQNPEEMIEASRTLLGAARRFAAITKIGLTNQRETTIVWRPSTSRAIAPAIVWEDKRTDPIAKSLLADNRIVNELKVTGLTPSSYFSALKLQWLMRHVVADGDVTDLAFGTVDSWLLFRLTGVHATDETNASRTMLYDIKSRRWSETICETLAIDRKVLPAVYPSRGFFGHTADGPAVPIEAVAGDQQASLFAAGTSRGNMKITAGTGLFVAKLLGDQWAELPGYTTSLAISANRSPSYYLEGHLENIGARWEAARHRPKTKPSVASDIAAQAASLARPLIEATTPPIVVDGGLSQDSVFMAALASAIRHPILPQITPEGTALGMAKLLYQPAQNI